MKRKLLTFLLAVLSTPLFAQTGDGSNDLEIYISDHIRDCQSEGFIRVISRSTGHVGMLNKEDRLAIPAEYSDLTPVRNGLIYALKGATRMFTPDGEHFHWEGGETMLIDTNNQVLARNIDPNADLNLYSMELTDLPSASPIRYNIEALNGQYYSFVAFDREFESWLSTELLPNFSKQTLFETAHPKITFWTAEDGWVSENQHSFIERNFEDIRKKLATLSNPATRYEIFTDGLDPHTFHSGELQDYFNSCGEFKTWLYPVKVIVISRESEDDMQQDHFDFLRTRQGYKLISVSLSPEQ